MMAGLLVAKVAPAKDYPCRSRQAGIALIEVNVGFPK
jgi:hypothetical protein